MAIWLVRAGKHGEREDLALDQGFATIGWEELPDMANLKKREELAKLLKENYPDEKPKTLINWEAQLWPFINSIQQNDLIVLPLKSRSTIAIGKVTGSYCYRDVPQIGNLHTRPVKWIKEFPRSVFDQDLLYSFGAFMTVCQIKRNDAEERIKAIIEGKTKEVIKIDKNLTNEINEYETLPDFEQLVRDQIREYVGRKFKGHDLSNLVAAVLTSQGYKVQVSPEGPDGGIDIIAGRGPLGFESPRLAVQVKSSETPVDVRVLRELQGVLKQFGAEQGLLVAWGGYNKAVAKEAAKLYFEIRLWDAESLVREIQSHYHDLPESVQAELPLKQLWALVQSED